MFCSKCGQQIADGLTFCPHCGNNLTGAGPAVAGKVNTWLIPSILATVFCCLPFGIVSIIYAVGANDALAQGNFALAKDKAAAAKKWFFVALICGILSQVLCVIVWVIGVCATAASAA